MCLKKTILTLFFLNFFSSIASAGTIRDGGDNPVKDPEWTCVSADLTLGMDVKLAWRKAEVQVTLPTSDLVYESGLREIFRAYTQAGGDLGMTDSTIHFLKGEMDLAASIYLEQKDSQNFYRGRISAKVQGNTYKQVELLCDHQPPSLRTDYVEYFR